MKLKTALGLASIALGCFVMSGCEEVSAGGASGDVYPHTQSPYPLNWNKDKNNWDTIELPAPVQSEISRQLAFYFGSPDHPKRPGAGELPEFPFNVATPPAGAEPVAHEDPLVHGRKLYVKHCMHCHGYYGWGDGPTADFLLPRPRDFRRGDVKFTSTGMGAKPTHDDLKRTIAQGVQGTMMPAFGPVIPGKDLEEIGITSGFAGPPDFDLEAVASYVEVLLMRGELERKLCLVYNDDPDNFTSKAVKAQLDGILAAWKDAPNQVFKPDVSKRPERTPAEIEKSVAAGKQLFLTKSAQCVSCHGPLGLGDALDPNQKNDWGLPALPANLTLGTYRGGRRPVDLYRRIAVGIKGSPMPSFGALKPEEIWQIVDYVQALGMRSDKPE